MRTSIAMPIAAALLAACGTPQERAAYREDPIKAMEPQYASACDRLGYGKDSSQRRECIARLSRHDDLVDQSLYYDRYMSWYLLR